MRIARIVVVAVLLLLGVVSRQVAALVLRGPLIVGRVMVGLDPSALAVDEQARHVFVSNASSGTLSMLDAERGALLRTIAVGGVPTQIAVAAQPGRAFILNDATNTVSVLDSRTGDVLRTVPLGAGTDLAVDDRRGRVFVVGLLPDGSSGIYVLDARSGSVRQTIRTALDSWGVAVDPPSGQLVVTNRGDGTTSLLDVAHGRVLRSVPSGAHPAGVAVDALLGHAFVANNGNSAQATGGTISMVDTRRGTVLGTVRVSRDPATVAVGAQTNRVFVVHGRGGGKGRNADSGPGGTDVLDARSGRLLRTLPVGALPVDDVGTALYPHMVVVDERHGHVFVINRTTLDRSGQATTGHVSVLDATTGRLLRTIAVGREPVALALDAADDRLFVANKDGEDAAGSRQTAWSWVPSWLGRWLPFVPAPQRPGNAGSITIIDTSRL